MITVYCNSCNTTFSIYLDNNEYYDDVGYCIFCGSNDIARVDFRDYSDFTDYTYSDE